MTRWQTARAALGAVGLIVGLIGIALAFRPLVWGAVALLAVAFVLRFTDRLGPDRGSDG